jgi:hypothetical protein
MPAPPPQSTSVGVSASNSGQQLVRRNDVTQAPPAFNAAPYAEALGQTNDQVQAGFAQGQQSLDDRAAAEQGLGEVNAEHATAAADYNRDFAEMQAETDAIVQEVVARKTDELNQRIAMVPQEDPGKIWGDNNAFQNAAGLLSAFAGGILAVTTGSGRNMGLEAIERAIDRNIAAQRTNIENEWKRVAHDKDTLQGYKDWQVQSKAWANQQRALMLETLALEREAKAQTFSSASKQAELMGMAAQLRVQSAQAQQAYISDVVNLAKAETDSAMNRWLQTEKLSLDKLNSSASRAVNYAQADLYRAQAGAARAPKAPLVLSDRTGMTTVGPDGKRVLYQPRNEDEKKQLDEIGVAHTRKHSTLSYMKEFLKTKPSSWSPEDRQRFTGLVTEYIQTSGESLGRMTDKDIEQLKANAPDPTKFANFLLSKDATEKTINDTMEVNRSTYEIKAQQVNRDIRVKLPDADPVATAQFGPQDARYSDDVGNASLQLGAAFFDTSKNAPKRKVEALAALENSLTSQRVAGSGAPQYITEADVKDVDRALAELAKVPRAQRQVRLPDGSTQDALDRLRALREYTLTKVGVQGLVGPMDRSETMSATGVNVLDPVNPNRKK